jgi:hypothetical protein
MNTVRIHEDSEEESIILLLLICNHYIKCFCYPKYSQHKILIIKLRKEDMPSFLNKFNPSRDTHTHTCVDNKQQQMSMGLKKTSGAHGKT